MIPMPGRAQPPAAGIFGEFGKGKENMLPHSFNVQLAGFTSIPRARTFNTHTLTIQMRLNMGSAHENKRDH